MVYKQFKSRKVSEILKHFVRTYEVRIPLNLEILSTHTDPMYHTPLPELFCRQNQNKLFGNGGSYFTK